MHSRLPALAGLAVAIVALTALAAGCANDGPDAAIAAAQRSVVAVEAQTCMDPNHRHGVGIVVDGDIVVTAGHTVEGELRTLTVDGLSASVVAIDRNADLAALHVDGLSAPPAQVSALATDRLTQLAPATATAVEVTSRGTLVIEHATDRATYRRDAIAFRPGVVEGASGSPLVDDAGRLVGIVILNDEHTGEGVAVTAGELSALLDVLAEEDVGPLHYC